MILCFHYFQGHSPQRFKRIISNDINIFYQFVKNIAESKSISIINPNSFKTDDLSNPSIMFTFDDGLYTQYRAAEILASYKIKAIFFICSCVLDNIPANPMIIHHGISECGIRVFSNYFNEAIENRVSQPYKYMLKFDIDYSPDEIINNIKSTVKYKLPYDSSVAVLKDIYNNHLLPEYNCEMNEIHMTENQINSLLDMGHVIGCHTHNHVVINDASFSENDLLQTQITKSKEIIEKRFDCCVNYFAYPFGSSIDTLSKHHNKIISTNFSKAFTTYNYNVKTDNYSIGRYCVQSNASVDDLFSLISR